MARVFFLSLCLVMTTTLCVADTWATVDQYIPVRQKAFCNLMDQYETKGREAKASKNQIKENQVIVDRGQDLLALMPEGQFTNWLVQVEEVFVAPSGDAAYDMKLQCGASIGSGQLEAGQEYFATAPKGSVIYNQLADVSAGDFILVNGKLVKFSQMNADDGKPVFGSILRKTTVEKYERFNDLVKYFADVSSLAKFATN